MVAVEQKVILSCGGGKDSVVAFMGLRCGPHYRIGSMLTTITEGYERVNIHGVRASLLTIPSVKQRAVRVYDAEGNGSRSGG
jgi:hypothetical protein